MDAIKALARFGSGPAGDEIKSASNLQIASQVSRRGIIIGAAAALFVPAIPRIVRANSLMELTGTPMLFGDQKYWVKGVDLAGRPFTDRLEEHQLSRVMRRMISCGGGSKEFRTLNYTDNFRWGAFADNVTTWNTFQPEYMCPIGFHWDADLRPSRPLREEASHQDNRPLPLGRFLEGA